MSSALLQLQRDFESSEEVTLAAEVSPDDEATNIVQARLRDQLHAVEAAKEHVDRPTEARLLSHGLSLSFTKPCSIREA